jgi:protein-glutamine gamma-glutamyltransferase
MKTPPMLIGATLLFWGAQTGFLPESAIMAILLESSRIVKTRWEFSTDEFGRVWTFCNVLLLAVMIVAFNGSGGLGDISQFFENPNVTTERNAGNAGTMTADAAIRWLPMIFFLFIAAQTYSPADGVPLESVSFWLRSRAKKAKKRGQPLPPSRRFNALYPYFALCLFSAAGHAAQNDYFYFGLCALLAWALWPQRSQRFALPVWIALLAVAVVVGYFGQLAFGQMSRLAEEYDPQLLAWFMRSQADPVKSRTVIGESGRIRLSGKIVIRIEPLEGIPPPTYLREATYRRLRETSQSLIWDAGSTNNDEFPPVSESPADSGIWPLHPNSANRNLVRIACYLDSINVEDKYPDGILPLPSDCNRLEELRAYSVRQNYLGTVLAEGPRLMIFEARFGSGRITDDAPEADESPAMTNEDLSVPPAEVPALQTVLSRLRLTDKSDDQKFLAISSFFEKNFTYTLDQEPATDTSPLAQFLLETRRGHCEYFATATVLLLRELGIPARYAVGYYVHEPAGHGYVVRRWDAHAWCLAWNQQKSCWENFDTTPSSWVAQEETGASPLQFLSDFASWVEFETLKFFDYSHDNIREYIFWALIPALAFLLYRIFRGSRRHRENEKPPDAPAWPGLDSEFYRLEQKLARKGLPREPGEPLSTWLRRATNDPQLAGLKQPLETILLLHYRYRFDPCGLNGSERETLRREVGTCLAASRSFTDAKLLI